MRFGDFVVTSTNSRKIAKHTLTDGGGAGGAKWADRGENIGNVCECIFFLSETTDALIVFNV